MTLVANEVPIAAATQGIREVREATRLGEVALSDVPNDLHIARPI